MLLKFPHKQKITATTQPIVREYLLKNIGISPSVPIVRNTIGPAPRPVTALPTDEHVDAAKTNQFKKDAS